jgi:ubiquinone/menaquinone biosynthesis C-methylase UbiE
MAFGKNVNNAKKFVCPWWMGYLLINPFRRLVQDPRKILHGLVSEGMTVLEPGPGMGYFTIELARLVGASGRVGAVDVQQKMIDEMLRRAGEAGVAGRIQGRLADGTSICAVDLNGSVDFVLAFAMVHELPDPELFFEEAYRCLKPGGRMLLAEPNGHVRKGAFEKELIHATAAGFTSGG